MDCNLRRSPNDLQFLQYAHAADQSIDNGAKVYAAHEVHAWLMQMALQSNTTDRPNPCDPPKSPSI
jgi:hypothetical protein